MSMLFASMRPALSRLWLARRIDFLMLEAVPLFMAAAASCPVAITRTSATVAILPTHRMLRYPPWTSRAVATLKAHLRAEAHLTWIAEEVWIQLGHPVALLLLGRIELCLSGVAVQEI